MRVDRIVILLPALLGVSVAAHLGFSRASAQATPAATKAAAKTELGKKVRIPANVGLATNFAEDGQTATLIFDNLFVAVEPARKAAAGSLGQTATTTKVVTFEIPYSTDQKSVSMILDVRGFRDAGSGANVRLVACAGDETKVVNLATKPDPVKLKGTTREAIAAELSTAKFGDFQDRIAFTVQARSAKPVCQITVFLVADQDTDGEGSGGALLAVDSLDISISKASKGSYKR